MHAMYVTLCALQLLSGYALLWVNQGRGTYMSLIIYPMAIFFMEGPAPSSRARTHRHRHILARVLVCWHTQSRLRACARATWPEVLALTHKTLPGILVDVELETHARHAVRMKGLWPCVQAVAQRMWPLVGIRPQYLSSDWNPAMGVCMTACVRA